MPQATDMVLNMANRGWRIHLQVPITGHPRISDTILKPVPPIFLVPLKFRVVKRLRLRISRLKKVTHLA